MAFTKWGGDDETPPDFEMITYNLPPPTGTQVLLRVDAAGVCHSDLMICAPPKVTRDMGWVPPAEPRVLGHENAGTVIAVGPDVRDVKVGDRRVAYPWGSSCSYRCGNCRAGAENICLGASMDPPCADQRLGISGVPGGYASVIAVDAGYLVDHGSIPPELACTMCCSGITAYTAVRRVLRGTQYGPLPEGAAVLIVGAGGVGLNAVGLMKDLSPTTTVVVVDSDARKRAAAESAGADAFVAGGVDSEGQMAAIVKDLTGKTGDGLGPHAAIDFVGVPQTMELCMNSLRRGGKVVQVGMFNGILRFPLFNFPENSISVEGSLTGTLADFREMMALAREGKILTGRQIPVEKRPAREVRQALVDMHEKRVVGRVVVVHDHSLGA